MARGFNPIASLKRLIEQPNTELNRWQRVLRYSIELARHCAQELGRDRATQMAAALTYRTLFSLVPVFIVALLMFRAFGGFEQVSDNFNSQQVFTYLGFDTITYDATEGKTIGNTPGQDRPAPDDGATLNDPQPQTGGDADASDSQQEARARAQAELRAQADAIILQLSEKISGLSFASIGVVGVVLLVWAALALIITVERCFNTIYNCPQGRSWRLRVPIYWAVLTLGPVLLAGGAYAAEKLIGMTTGVPLLGALANFAGGFTSLATTWALLFLMYTLIPTTVVHKRPAAIGALVAALLWELGKIGFRLYVTKTLPFSALYGSLGLVPLFLLWVYLTWLMILFGLELTYTLQMMKGMRFRSLAQSGQMFFDQRAVIALMAAIGDAFARGDSLKEQRAAERLGMPIAAVNQVAQSLEKAGLIHRVGGEDDDPGYALSRPASSIHVRDILDLADGLTLNVSSESVATEKATQTLDRIRAAEREAAGEVTLADLCPDAQSPSAS